MYAPTKSDFKMAAIHWAGGLLALLIALVGTYFCVVAGMTIEKEARVEVAQHWATAVENGAASFSSAFSDSFTKGDK